MNNNLLNIVKRIVAEKGENVLADPQKLKPLFSDYAKNEPKEDRAAFGRCIEMGSYQELKNTSTDDERRRKKAALTDQLNTKYGIDKARCADALDLLDAAITRQAQPVSPPPQSTTPSGAQTKTTKRISKRTIAFGIAGAVGGGIGSWIGGYLAAGFRGSTFMAIMNWTVWTAAVAIGVSLGLLVAQSIYLKKKSSVKFIAKTVIIGLIISAAAGALAGVTVIFGNSISMATIGRIAAWMFTGLGIGLVATLFIPNFPKKRAMLAGLIGGGIGGISAVLTGNTVVIIGDMILGLFVGLSVSFIEEALRQAWLTIIYGKNETTAVSLGEKPIIFGSSSEADIYLPKDKEPPVRATVQIENSRVVMYDKKTNQRQVLQNGDKVDFEKVSFVVNTKKS